MISLKNILPVFVKNFIWDAVTHLRIQLYKRNNSCFSLRKNSTDFKVFQEIFVKGEFSFPINFKPKVIVDAGAYSGISALYFSMRFPNAKIIGIEPESDNFDQFKKNTYNFKEKIHGLNAGVWYKSGFLKIKDDKHGHWGFQVEEVEKNDSYDVKALSVDDIISKFELDKIDILKIDIEGSEKELFENETPWLDKVNLIIIELHDRFKPGCSDVVNAKLKNEQWNWFETGEKIVFQRRKLI